MTITCDGGTTFTVKSGQVVITRHDQPESTIPLADLQEFLELYIDVDLEEDGDDL